MRRFFLPPYSPQVILVELVWNLVRNQRVGRAKLRSKDDLKRILVPAMFALQELSGKN